MNLNPSLAASLAVSASIGITTAIAAPEQLGVSLAFTGGVSAGLCSLRERKSRLEKETETGHRVTSVFAALYESNRGLVDPVQLSFLANIPLDKAHTFLSTVAEANNGQKVPTKGGTGAVFTFPHTQGALDELSSNAQKWAEAQTKKMASDLDEHKRAIQYLQLQQKAAAAGTSIPQIKDEPSPWENVNP